MARSTQARGAVRGRTNTFRRRLAIEPLLLVADAGLVAVAYGLALLARFDGSVPGPALQVFWRFVPLAVVAHIVWNAMGGLYGRVWPEAGVDEARACVVAGIGAVTTLLVTAAGIPAVSMPWPVVAIGGALALLSLGGARFRARLSGARPSPATAGATRVVLIGPVDIARPVIQQMLGDPAHDLEPVAVLNGNPGHWGRTVAGVPVFGPLSSLAAVAREHDADEVLLALSSDDPREVRRAADVAREAGLPARILPSVHDVVASRPILRDIRDLSIDDLLGRQQVETDMVAIRSLLAGKRVLITGGGGSIGSEIARQVATFAPARLLLLDHDETHLHDAVADLDDAAATVLGDIRDAVFLDRLLRTERPEVVFHAAAHKHVPILERFPAEAVATNIRGTENVLRAARDNGVERVVLISTDKAVNPSSVMGATKRIGEQLLIHARPVGGRYCAVRFGNVLGSRGSVIPTFLRQIEAGGPVTVTHPSMTRYFMSIREAVQLVLQAAVLTQGGEIFMLDMGEPVRIIELAKRLIFLSGAMPGRDIEIEMTGIRPGEKLHEEIVSSVEEELPTEHPHIRVVRSPVLPAATLESGIDELLHAVAANDDTGVRRGLRHLVTTAEPVPVTAGRAKVGA